MKGGWRCASIANGAQYVHLASTTERPRSPVGIWALIWTKLVSLSRVCATTYN